MWIPWAWALAAFLLAAGGASVAALRSSLLIVGEEGLAEDASAGKEIAAELLSTVRDPEVRHPFSLWVAASAFKTVAGLCAGVAAVSLFGHLRGGAGAARAAGGSRGRKAFGPPRPTPVREGLCPRGPAGHPFRRGGRDARCDRGRGRARHDRSHGGEDDRGGLALRGDAGKRGDDSLVRGRVLAEGDGVRGRGGRRREHRLLALSRSESERRRNRGDRLLPELFPAGGVRTMGSVHRKARVRPRIGEGVGSAPPVPEGKGPSGRRYRRARQAVRDHHDPRPPRGDRRKTGGGGGIPRGPGGGEGRGAGGARRDAG